MLKGKNVLITGTNRGIGKSVLEIFAQNGANIIAHSRNKNEEHEKYLKEISAKNNINIFPIYFDLNDKLKIKEVFKTFYKDKIAIDILVNNAGIAHGGYFQMTPVSKIKEIFEINLFSQMEITQYVLKIMSKQNSGAIINLASIAGLDLEQGNSAYGVSKAAIIAWTKTLALEVARYNIRVNAVAPSLVDTNMAKQMEEKSGISMLEKSAMKRLANPDEIAKAILFLASDNASFITGQVIRVDGGMS